jgi:hypothetical protein
MDKEEVLSELSDQMEVALTRIRSVLGVRVILDPEEEVTEVHILASEERNPKQVVRDAESTLLIKFDKRVDHRKIGVVQQASEGPKDYEKRLKFETLRLVSIADESCWEVVLATPNNKLFIGNAPKGDSSSTLMAISTATLAAVNQYAGEERFRFGSVSQLTGDPPLVLVTMQWLDSTEEIKLVGVAATRGDEREATVKATLSALHRVLHRPVKRAS